MDTTAKSSQSLEPHTSSVMRAWLVRAGYALALAVALTIVDALVSHLFSDGMDGVRYLQALNERPEAVFVYVSALLVAPLLETLVMAWLILLMLERLSRPVVICLSGLLWAAIHMATNPGGWMMFFPFAAYSYVFIRRRQQDRPDGFSLVVMAHFFHNLFVLFVATGAGVITWQV